MYIGVIPTSKSLGKDPYIYFVSELWKDQVSLGGMVEIPLGNTLVTGIVTDIKEENTSGVLGDAIRPIHSVISMTPLITKNMVAMICLIADRYFLLIHKAISLFLPSPLLSRLEKKNYLLKNPIKENPIGKPKTEIHHYIHKIFSPNDLGSYLEKGTILVFPDDIMLLIFTKQLESKNKNIFILSNEATSTKKAQAWIDIYEGKYSIIVGTRRILYYNLQAYSKIIYIEDAFGGEQYQYPVNIRSLDILKSLEEVKTHDITIITSTPTLELLSRFSGNSIVPKGVAMKNEGVSLL